MNFISWGRPRIGITSFCTPVRTRFCIQKFSKPFSLYQKNPCISKVILVRPKDTFSLGGVFNNAWIICCSPIHHHIHQMHCIGN